MAPYSTDQESINNNKDYENGEEIIEHVYDTRNQDKNSINATKVSLKENSINDNCSNYFKEISNYTTMATYAQYMPQQIYNFPITINDWNPIITLPTPIYTSVQQVPFVPINPQTINPTVIPPLCPCGTVITEPMIPAIPDAVPIPESFYETLVNYIPETVTPQSVSNTNIKEHHEVIEDKLTPTESVNSDTEESIESYLGLPKELFPTARMFTIDPNQIIDVFCDEDISDHTPWLLDLEFGLPRIAVTRHIPIYDVQFNSIHCKNTPSAIHPGFERCSKSFKRELLFYYDCIVSTWYKGFVAMKNDTSVKNFQTWLLKAMQVFGMCWP